MSDTHAPVDFKQQLAAHQQRVNQALLDFIAPLPFGNSNLIEAMRYGAVIGVSVSAPIWSMPQGKCLVCHSPT